MRMLRPTQIDAQRTISRLINAYPLWISGIIAAEKWPAFVTKMSARYEVDISPAARQWRKRRCQCNTHLIGAELPTKETGEQIRWVMLVSEQGRGMIKDLESLQDARRERLVWGDYVLMHLTRPRVHGGGSRWTWCLLPQIEQQEANYLTALAQSAGKQRDAKRLDAFIRQSLLRRPMHSGVRTQVAKMLRRARVVWVRHSHDAPWPSVEPDKLPHLGAYRAAQ
ncbi:hypothetical protein [Thiorhodovibrio winogradskyi]|uniref:hypothetical protein n=2 Tax=Thiorhodovibrio TaxID=61593 RepID=UPI001914B3D3|nr:hypothetical protein [Thiorhodovibrio winogradskyi]